MGAEKTNKYGIHSEFDFHDKPESSAMDTKNNTAIAADARFGEVQFKIAKAFPRRGNDVLLFGFVQADINPCFPGTEP